MLLSHLKNVRNKPRIFVWIWGWNIRSPCRTVLLPCPEFSVYGLLIDKTFGKWFGECQNSGKRVQADSKVRRALSNDNSSKVEHKIESRPYFSSSHSHRSCRCRGIDSRQLHGCLDGKMKTTKWMENTDPLLARQPFCDRLSWQIKPREDYRILPRIGPIIYLPGPDRK